MRKEHGSSLAEYRVSVRHKLRVIVLLLIGVGAMFVLNVMFGSTSIPFADLMAVLGGGDTGNSYSTIVWDIRLPIACMAMAVGAALAIGGCEMQTILGNPMASPYMLGISAAAAFGAAAGIILDLNFAGVPEHFLITGNAFLVSLVAAFLIYRFAARPQSSRHMLILFGIALNFIFNSLTMFLQYIADESKLQSLVFWSFGSLAKATWDKTLILSVILLAVIVFLCRRSWDLTALSMGDTRAKSLGVEVHRLRREVLIWVSLLTAAAVCFVGTIGFLGLVAPHLARWLVGEEQRYLLPAAALFGAFLLSAAAILSKMLIVGTLLPIGLVTSLLGIPFFIVLIFRQGGRVS